VFSHPVRKSKVLITFSFTIGWREVDGFGLLGRVEGAGPPADFFVF